MSVVRIASAASRQACRRRATARRSAGQRADDLVGGRRLADHAGRGDEHLAGHRIRELGHRGRRCASPPRPRRVPVKVLELPELTTMARALPRLTPARHQSTGAPRRLRLGEHAGDRGAGIEQRDHQIAPLFIADAAMRARRAVTPAMGGSAGKRSGASGEGVAIPTPVISISSWAAPVRRADRCRRRAASGRHGLAIGADNLDLGVARNSLTLAPITSP